MKMELEKIKKKKNENLMGSESCYLCSKKSFLKTLLIQEVSEYKALVIFALLIAKSLTQKNKNKRKKKTMNTKKKMRKEEN